MNEEENNDLIYIVEEILNKRHPEFNWFDITTAAVGWEEDGVLYKNRSTMRNKKLKELGI